MSRRVFYSFYYAEDAWRVSQIRQIGAIEGQRVVTSNEWEQIERQSEGVKRWIDEQMKGKSCVVVLIGQNTASRPWVKYEIEKGWNDKRGVLGVRIHGLLDYQQRTSLRGPNPFDGLTLNNGKERLSSHVPIFDPAGNNSKEIYASIKEYLGAWIDHAIQVRQNYTAAA